MKKRLILILFFFTFCFLIPRDVFAKEHYLNAPVGGGFKETDLGPVVLKDLEFVDYSDTSAMAFGLVGYLYNQTDGEVTVTAKVEYFDKDYNIIAVSNTIKTIEGSGRKEYLLTSNLSIIDVGYTVKDIKFYRLTIEGQVTSGGKVLFTPSKMEDFSLYDYVIDSYDVVIKVNEDNTYDIEETITTYFNYNKHGIYRKIPMKNNVVRLDGSTAKIRARVLDVFVNEKFTESRESGNYVIKIGSPNKTLLGAKTYKIKYTYALGNDKTKNYDELYFNIIGTEWDTVIGHVNFRIEMPSEFDAKKLGFSVGRAGSTYNGVDYNVEGNVITGSYSNILREKEGITVRLELPEGYFDYEMFKELKYYGVGIYPFFLLPIICLIISAFMWFKYGRDEEVIETVEFYPPEGFNSLEVGYLYKGSVDDEDIVSLLIYLANKGYIRIKEIEEENIFSKRKTFEIEKIREYDGNNSNEREFLTGLFKRKKYFASFKIPSVDNPNVVTESDLRNSFYKTMKKIKTNMNSKINKNKIFDKTASKKSISVIMMIVVTLLTIVAVPTFDYAGWEEFFLTCFLALFYLPFYAVAFSKENPFAFKIFILFFLIFHSGAFFSTMPIAGALMSDSVYLIGFILGVLSIIGMLFFFNYMPKRTKYGNEVLGKIRGFKNFLETAEKSRIESMVQLNPTYFYDILPYAYVLGVSDKWIKQFEVIGFEEPSWYSGTGDFSPSSFNRFMTKTMSSAKSSMSSSPSSSSGGSSGGGSSGGGSSGGGSGGGGGGSW